MAGLQSGQSSPTVRNNQHQLAIEIKASRAYWPRGADILLKGIKTEFPFFDWLPCENTAPS